jgi:hypothetical protein
MQLIFSGLEKLLETPQKIVIGKKLISFDFIFPCFFIRKIYLKIRKHLFQTIFAVLPCLNCHVFSKLILRFPLINTYQGLARNEKKANAFVYRLHEFFS